MLSAESLSNVDILIVGGGPSGLLTASILALRHKVVVIEKETLGRTKKFWVTTERPLKKHDLDHCVLYKTPKMMAGTFLGGEATAAGDFAVVDDERLLRVLTTRCRERGVRLIENCRLINIHWTAFRVHTHTTSGTFSARVIADASGGGSAISKTFRDDRPRPAIAFHRTL